VLQGAAERRAFLSCHLRPGHHSLPAVPKGILAGFAQGRTSLKLFGNGNANMICFTLENGDRVAVFSSLTFQIILPL